MLIVLTYWGNSRNDNERLTCKACMASRFWFLVSVLPIGGKDRIQEQKRVFVSDINYEADWTEEVQKPKTKTRFCFSFLSDRLDRPKKTGVST